jgi:hypothetical protein
MKRVLAIESTASRPRMATCRVVTTSTVSPTEVSSLLALVKEIRDTVEARYEYTRLPVARDSYGMP